MNGSLGLAPEDVRVEPHSDEWGEAYETERVRLAGALGDLVVDIQHVGSTAVPGLAAKPIVDIAIAIPEASFAQRVSQVLTTLGYEFAVDAGNEGGLIFFRESNPPLRTHHVHIVEHRDPQWRNYLKFRDLLRADSDLRSKYARLKDRLVRDYANDRPGYTNAKTEFIRTALAREPDNAN